MLRDPMNPVCVNTLQGTFRSPLNMDAEKAIHLVRTILYAVAEADHDTLKAWGIEDETMLRMISSMRVGDPSDEQRETLTLGFFHPPTEIDMVATAFDLTYYEDEDSRYPGDGAFVRTSALMKCPHCGRIHAGDHDEAECDYQLNAGYDAYGRGSC
jgi:hypothetical protein